MTRGAPSQRSRGRRQKSTTRWSPSFAHFFDVQHEDHHPEVCRLYRPALRFSDYPTARIRPNVRFAVAYGALFELNAPTFRKGWAMRSPEPMSSRYVYLQIGINAFADRT